MDAEKQKYIDELQKQLERFEGRLNDIEAQANTAGEEMKKEYAAQAKVLEEKMRDARTALKELRESGEQSWSTTKEKVERTWDDLNNAFSDVAAALTP